MNLKNPTIFFKWDFLSFLFLSEISINTNVDAKGIA